LPSDRGKSAPVFAEDSETYVEVETVTYVEVETVEAAPSVVPARPKPPKRIAAQGKFQ
jgi:hypothetical protein